MLHRFLTGCYGAWIHGVISQGHDHQKRHRNVHTDFKARQLGIGYRGDLLEDSFQPSALIALTALAMGTRNAVVRYWLRHRVSPTRSPSKTCSRPTMPSS